MFNHAIPVLGKEEDAVDDYAAYEYIDEHSFDLQRYCSTLCLVYGSNPQQHAHLDLEDRKQFCEERFMQVNQNWQVFLHKKSP